MVTPSTGDFSSPTVWMSLPPIDSPTAMYRLGDGDGDLLDAGWGERSSDSAAGRRGL